MTVTALSTCLFIVSLMLLLAGFGVVVTLMNLYVD